MRVALKTAAGIALAGLLAVASAAAEDGAIATTGAGAVKAADIADFLKFLNPAQRKQAAQDPKVMDQVIRAAVSRKLVLDAAQKDGWAKKPDIAQRLEFQRQQTIFETYLASLAAPPSGFPSESEIQTVYQQNREQFAAPRQFHLSQIYIAAPPGMAKDAATAAERKARDLDRKAKAKGTDFAELAQTNSQDSASAPHGGDLGWLAENQIAQPEILAAIRTLGDKGVSDPVRSRDGWHILWLMGVKPPEVQPLETVRDLIAGRLREAKLQQNEKAYLDKLLTDQHVVVNEPAASALFQGK